MPDNYLHEMFIKEAKCAIDSRANSGGVQLNNQEKVITADGVYTPDAGYTGFGKVTVSAAATTVDTLLDANY